MWNNVFSPDLNKSLVVTITDDCDVAEPDMAVEADPQVISLYVVQVVDGVATLVVVFAGGEPEGEAYQLPVGGLNAEETSRYLNGLDAEDLLDLFEDDDEGE